MIRPEKLLSVEIIADAIWVYFVQNLPLGRKNHRPLPSTNQLRAYIWMRDQLKHANNN